MCSTDTHSVHHANTSSQHHVHKTLASMQHVPHHTPTQNHRKPNRIAICLSGATMLTAAEGLMPHKT
jgi:hypothetical protein